MNTLADANKKQIFEAQIGSAELEAVNVLVSKHKANVAITQQLALDASKLVSSSQERLAKQSEAGFFKRLSSAISGKTSENQLLNQVDILQMQKFSWHYLQQLQQQNLINAQSIAVIRNNLGTITEYVIETRDFLELAIDKIDNRLQYVENNTSFNTWSLSIDSNKRRYKLIPKTLLILRLTYDFMRSHQDISLTERDINNYLVTTLERLDVNCDEEVRLLDFIGELIDQIEVVGVDKYRKIIELSFDDYVVESDYVQRNISGVGFNALYYLSDNYEKILDLISDDLLCNSDEARWVIISKLFGSEFSELSTVYSIRDLICEIIGGSQLAIDVYKDDHGLNVLQDEIVEEQQSEVEPIFSSLPDIRLHTFLDSHESDEAKRNYLLLLALCFESSESLKGHAREFITLLAEKSGFPELQQEIVELADNPHKHNDYLAVMKFLLDDEDKKYTWLLDALFLLLLAQKQIETSQVKAVIGVLKLAQLKESLPNILMIISGDDVSQILNAVYKLEPLTQGWKNIIQYRELRFDQYFGETDKCLRTASWAVAHLNLEMSDVYRKGMEHAVYFSFSDGGFLSSVSDKAGAALCTQGRKSAVSSLNEFRMKAGDCISKHHSALIQANGLISRWSLPSFEFNYVNHYSDFDLDNSTENEEWGGQFEHYYHLIEDQLIAFSEACDGASEQLDLFMKGIFDQSVLKRREQKRLEHVRQQELEKQEKQCATVIKDGKEHFFGIVWQTIEDLPFDPRDIDHIKTDGNIWFVVVSGDSNDSFYRSEDGVHWQKVQLDSPDIRICADRVDVINGVWILKNKELVEGTREVGFYYSIDAITWQHSPAPEPSKRNRSINDGCMFFEDILFFNGLWLWCGQQYKKYSYTEKGFFSDSTKTGNYQSIAIYSAKELAGPWQPWDGTPEFPEGVEVVKIRTLPGRNALLAFCKYGYSFIRDKKKPKSPPFVMYYGVTNSWNSCNWGGDEEKLSHGDSSIIANIDNRLMCFNAGEILCSDKGYEWKKEEATLYADYYCLVNGVGIFFKRSASAIYLSQDARNFKEILLEDGHWNYLTANEEGIVGVYYVNQHEKTVLRFGSYFCRVKI